MQFSHYGDRFVKFSIDRLSDNTVTDFDLFIKVADHIILYGGKGYRWERHELQGLLDNGTVEFFARQEDQEKIAVYEKIVLLPELEKKLAPRDRMQFIQEVGTRFTKNLFDLAVTEACVEKAREIAGALVDCILEDNSCVQALSGLGNHDEYTYQHSMRVAGYIAAISIQMGLKDRQQLIDMSLGGIFHDVGKKEIPLSVLHKKGALTKEEWTKMRAHPSLGYLAVSNSILSFVPKEIILHHHEKLDGSGYPDELAKGSLLTEVQISAVADIFDALTSTRSYQQKRSRFEALDFMRHKMIGTVLATEPFQALIACLVKDSLIKVA